MRPCRHCSHDNADHLSYCSRCGHRLAGATSSTGLVIAAAATQSGGVRPPSSVAFSRTLVASPTGDRPTVALKSAGRATTLGGRPRARSQLGWAGDSIGYIYVYLRGKLDAGERRRRLLDERAGAEALLSSAINELASAVLREGVQHGDLTGLLEAIGRAHAHREGAAADLDAADTLEQAEATRLGAQQEAAEAEWLASDRASRDADDILRATLADRGTAAARLGRVKDERGKLERERTGDSSAAPARAAQRAHEAVGLAAEQEALEAQVERLDQQLADLRDNSAAMRTAAAASRAKLDRAVANRRDAAAAMAASIAGRQRDRALAERQVAELTEQLGRAAAEIRPPHVALLSAYQNIDRLTATIADRGAQLAAMEQTPAHYDHRKLLTGVGLLTSVLIATAAAIWAVLK
jgi:hypothetical protein